MEEDQQTTINLPRFGTCTYAESEVIEFPWGLPGFPTLVRWLPLIVDSHPSFVWFQSLEDHEIAIPTADPWALFDNYDPKLPAYAFTSLEIREAADFATLCVVVVTPKAEEMTINLMAPLVVNLRNRKGRQIVLDTTAYTAREAIPRKVPASSKSA